MECFVGKGGKQYELLPELDDLVPPEPEAEPPHTSTDTSTQRKRKKKVRAIICYMHGTESHLKDVYVYTDVNKSS